MGQSEEAAATIRAPLGIYRSHQKPTRCVYYRLAQLSGISGMVYWRVITDLDNNGEWWLISAHLATRPDAPEVPLWL